MMKSYNKQLLTEYYVDFETTNISFLKMAAILDAAGIENNLFFLRLNNKKLRGVNPYDNNLTDDLRIQIFRESATNRWYFYREIFRVSESGTSIDPGGGVAFELNRGNLAYLWAMEMNISAYLIMPRQTGKTWAAIADATWTHQFIQGSSILHFNKSQKDANDNLRRIREAVRMLPLYMQYSNEENLDSADKRLVKNNEKNIRNSINASIEAMASAGNEAKADAMARGRTASKIWYDELAYIFFISTIYGAATPAYSKAKEIAIKNNIPYGISITTTPGDLATPHGAFAYEMMTNSIKFNESLYDYKRKKLYDIIMNTPDKASRLFIQFNYLQLGNTDDWFIQRTKDMSDVLKIRREYLLEWLNSNGNSPFEEDDLDIIHELTKQKESGSKTFKINKYFDLEVYSEYHGRKPVLIGVDVATGRGRDQHAITVVNPETLQPMAFFHSNMISSTLLKKIIITLITKRYTNAILTIENNSVGTPLIDELRDSPIARYLYKEKKKRTIDQNVSSIGGKRKITSMEYGHNVNKESRDQMMDMLETIVHYNHSHVAFPELYNEIVHMEIKNGRIDHSSSTHDDVTMSYLGVLWIVRYGNGLKGKGIHYNIKESSDDEDSYDYDTSRIANRANHIIFNKPTTDDYDSDGFELVSYMSSNQPVEDSGTWAERERAEYYKELDKIDGVCRSEDDFESAVDTITDSTQRLILRNYYSLMHMEDDDPLANLLKPQQMDQDHYLADAYKW